MKETSEERRIFTESPDAALLASALQTLKMIATAKVFNDGNDRMIMAEWKVLAEKEVALIEHKQKEFFRYIVFGDRADEEPNNE